MPTPVLRGLAVIATIALASIAAPSDAATAPEPTADQSRTLSARTAFTMAPDGSSGLTQGATAYRTSTR